jgi:putative transcriptional regulator
MRHLPFDKQHKSFQGKVLVASPMLASPPFNESVVLVLQHSEEGAHGTILNKTLNASVGGLWEKLSGEALPIEDLVHMGGPVSGPLFALHQQPKLAEMTTTTGVYLSATKEHLEQLVALSEGVTEAPFHLFVGHAKWEPGQLEQEVAQGMWLELPASAQLIFEEQEDKWLEALREVGRNFWKETIGAKHVPEDASVN